MNNSEGSYEGTVFLDQDAFVHTVWMLPILIGDINITLWQNPSKSPLFLCKGRVRYHLDDKQFDSKDIKQPLNFGEFETGEEAEKVVDDYIREERELFLKFFPDLKDNESLFPTKLTIKGDVDKFITILQDTQWAAIKKEQTA